MTVIIFLVFPFDYMIFLLDIDKMIFFVGYCKVVCEITFLGKGVMLPAEGKIKLMPHLLEGLASCFFISLYPFYFKIEPSLLKKRWGGI